MANPPKAFFLPADPGDRFCIHHPPAQGAGNGRGIVYVHPFCEEMNKARRMAALQARSLAAAGWAVLQIDLYGCGDSSGESGDARWEIWRRDVHAALGWLRQRVDGELSLWGLRLGAVLAADLARDGSLGVDQLLLWQPVLSGEQFLTQFLRLQLAAEMLAAGSARTGVNDLRAALARGEPLEIAGYELHPELASELDRLKLAACFPAVQRACWVEVSPQPEPKPTPASQRVLDEWRAKGLDIRAASVSGEPFWSTLEITDCPALLAATDEAMRQG